MDVIGQNGNTGDHYDDEDDDELDDIIEDISETVEEDRGLSWQRKPKIKEKPEVDSNESGVKDAGVFRGSKVKEEDIIKPTEIVGGQLAAKLKKN